MRWLRLAGQQYINTGLAPGAGYRVATNIRMRNNSNVMPLFGSRDSGATDFNMFFIGSYTDSYIRADYGGAGSDSAFPVDFSSVPSGEKLIFSIEFGKTTTISGKSWTSPTNSTGSSYPIYVGSINASGTADNRNTFADYSDFIIYDASDDIVFHGIPVPTGSTEFSSTPAPSNCYFDKISETYKQKAGGTGVIWYEDEDDNLAEEDNVQIQGADYGLKVLAEGNMDVAYMNSKYPLFGSDISNRESQFKTYEIVLTGYNSEPSPPFPAYKYDWNFYQGSGTIERTAYTIDTGLSGSTIKSILVQHSGVEDSNFYARAREQLYDGNGGTNIDSYLNPKSKNPPGYINLNQNVLFMVDGSTDDIVVLSGQFAQASFDTLGNFNGGTVNATYFTPPQVKVQIDTNGILRVKTVVPYNWIQRAGDYSGINEKYRVRWRDWAWYQGVVITVTVLNTPYTL